MLKDPRTRAGPVPRRVGAFEALCKAAARTSPPALGCRLEVQIEAS